MYTRFPVHGTQSVNGIVTETVQVADRHLFALPNIVVLVLERKAPVLENHHWIPEDLSSARLLASKADGGPT